MKNSQLNEIVTEFCPYCEKSTKTLHIVKDTIITIKGEKFEVPCEYYYCTICKEDYDTSKSKYDPIALAMEKYNKIHGTNLGNELVIE